VHAVELLAQANPSPTPEWCRRIPPAAVELGRSCGIEHVLDDVLRHRCRLNEVHAGAHICWCGQPYARRAIQEKRVVGTSVHVFNCPEGECRWARGLEYSDETAEESLEAVAGVCALDGKVTCPLTSPEQRAKLLGVPVPAGPKEK